MNFPMDSGNTLDQNIHMISDITMYHEPQHVYGHIAQSHLLDFERKILSWFSLSFYELLTNHLFNKYPHSVYSVSVTVLRPELYRKQH